MVRKLSRVKNQIKEQLENHLSRVTINNQIRTFDSWNLNIAIVCKCELFLVAYEYYWNVDMSNSSAEVKFLDNARLTRFFSRLRVTWPDWCLRTFPRCGSLCHCAILWRAFYVCYVTTAESKVFFHKNRYFTHKSHPSQFEISISRRTMTALASHFFYNRRFFKMWGNAFFITKASYRRRRYSFPRPGNGPGIVPLRVFALKKRFRVWAGTCRLPSRPTPHPAAPLWHTFLG